MPSIYPVSLSTSPEGPLCIDNIPVTKLAHQYGTPLYVMDRATLEKNCRSYTQALAQFYPNSLVVFAGKANLNLGLLNILAKEGLGVDVVSGGELFTALKSNIKPENIIFHGNNKSKEELKLAIDNHIRIVVDHEQELQLISSLATAQNKANLMLRLKPEIEAHTHDYIKTGHIDSKFGIDKASINRIVHLIKEQPNLNLLGIHSHIGSQIFDLEPFEDLATIMANHLADIKANCEIELTDLNLGGGIGIQYTAQDDPPPTAMYIERLTTKLKAACEKLGLTLPRLLIEPGRSIVATAGITLYTIGAIKVIPGIKEYIFVDGGMADNPRPMMYDAKYTFSIANKPHDTPTKTVTIAGKYCESGDILAKEVKLPEAQIGDTLVVYGTGAYNYSMSSNYNRSAKPAMILVENGDSRILVRRETYEDLMRYDNA